MSEAHNSALHVDYRQDHLLLTAGLYEAFLARGKRGRDALAIYMHLLYTYRRQKTSRIWATNSYIQQALQMGESRVERGKGLLREMGVIQTVRERNVLGRLSKAYVKLNLLPDPGPMLPKRAKDTTPAENAGMDSMGAKTATEATTPAATTPVVPDPKCLKKKRIRKTASVDAAPQSPKTLRGNSTIASEQSPQPLITALFFEKYAIRPGGKPEWTGKHGSLLKRDLSRLGVEKLHRLVLLFFDDPPQGVANWAAGAGWTYNIFHSQLPKLEAALAERKAALSLLRVCPRCGREQEHNGPDCLFCNSQLNVREAASG